MPKTKNLNINISLTNSKLGDKIPSLNLPTTICRADAPCKKGCYAKKGNWLFKNVVKCLDNNLEMFRQNPSGFFDDIIQWLNDDDIMFRFFRWFSSGDIVNYDFFKGIVRTAKECPQTNFLCFTKKFEIVNDYIMFNGDLPSNLNVVYSNWGDFKPSNPYNLPQTFVKFKNPLLNVNIPEYAIPCKGSCKSCKACWSLKKGQSVYFDIH